MSPDIILSERYQIMNEIYRKKMSLLKLSSSNKYMIFGEIRNKCLLSVVYDGFLALHGTKKL